MTLQGRNWGFHLRLPDNFRPERTYLADVIFRLFFGIPVQIHWDPGLAHQILSCQSPDGLLNGELIIHDGFFSERKDQWLSPSTLPRTAPERFSLINWPHVSPHSDLPIFFGDSPNIQRQENRISCDFDLFGTCFFFLTRYEEIAQPLRDHHDRFPFENSIAQKFDLVGRSLVDEYLQLLKTCMNQLWNSAPIALQGKFTIDLSCDLDRPTLFKNRSLMAVMRDLLREGISIPAIKKNAQRILKFLRTGDDPFDCLEWMMDIADMQNLKIAFNIMASRPHRLDAEYPLSFDFDRVPRILARQHDIGLHSSYLTWNDAIQMESEVNQLQRYTKALQSVRQHFLRLQVPRTWNIQEQAGLKVDTSLGFAEHPGFRAGTSRPFPVYDLINRRPLQLVERPLVLMDSSLCNRRYLGCQALGEKIALIRSLKAECRFHQSPYSILWHNSNLETDEARHLFLEAIRL